jgi:SAM-dependent methyltransferase
MKIIDFIRRKQVPQPWSEGYKIPWNDPAFSERMLSEHLNQDHNLASRKETLISQHVQWIHQFVLKKSPAKILDLGCGPGLYSSHLAKLGHQCVGIDFSPASITYAKNNAVKDDLNCRYVESDIRVADFGNNFDLVMLIFGEFNVFMKSDAESILVKAWDALKPGGFLILEPIRYNAVEQWGNQERSWSSYESGLFLASPHLALEEYFWDPNQKATTIRYFIIDGLNNEVIQHAQSVQAYTNKEFESMLVDHGFTNIRYYPSLMGKVNPEQENLMVILSEKIGKSERL